MSIERDKTLRETTKERQETIRKLSEPPIYPYGLTGDVGDHDIKSLMVRVTDLRAQRDISEDQLEKSRNRISALERAIIAMDEAICHNNVSEAKRIARAIIE